MTTKIESNKPHWQLALAALATDHAFAALAPTLTRPPKSFDAGGTHINLLPVGTDAADEVFDFRIVKWSRIGSLWVPQVLLTGTATLGTASGVSGNDDLPDTVLLADTITIGSGISNYTLFSPADNTPATLAVDVLGAQRVEIQFDLGTAAGANALYSFI